MTMHHMGDTITFIPAASDSTTLAPQWMRQIMPHLYTRKPKRVLVLIDADSTAMSVAQGIADAAASANSRFSHPLVGTVCIRSTATAASVEETIDMLPGRLVLVLETRNPYIQSETFTAPLTRIAQKYKCPIVCVVPKVEWETLSSFMRNEAFPVLPVTVDLTVSDNDGAPRTVLNRRARELEEFHQVEIPEATIESASRLIPSENDDPQPGYGVAALDLWASTCVLAGASTVTPPEVGSSRRVDYAGLVAQLSQSVRGQQQAIRVVSEQVALGESGLRMRSDRPASAVLLTGPTGTGKTLLAQSVADCLEVELVRVNMGAMNSDHHSATLLGSPPGYVGSSEKDGWLTSRLAKAPSCVLLLDEVDKAAPGLWAPLLLELLGAGTLTDYSGTCVDARRVHVILTANIGAEALTKSVSGFGEGLDRHRVAMKAVRSSMSPEIFNRLDAVVLMETLDRKRMAEILDQSLRQAIRAAHHAGFELSVLRDAREAILNEATTWPDGARRLHREIENVLYRPLLSRTRGCYVASMQGSHIVLTPDANECDTVQQLH